MSEALNEEDGLKVRKVKDLVRECGGVLASWVWGCAKIKPSDMKKVVVVYSWFAFYPNPG